MTSSIARARLTPVTVLLTLASVVVGGVLGQWRHSSDREAPPTTARVGQTATLDNHQTITPLAIMWGQYTADPHRGTGLMTEERFVGISFRMATPRDAEVSGVACELRSRHGVVTDSAQDSGLGFPAPGFQATGIVIFEVTRELAVDAQLYCRPRDLITYFQPWIRLDLGVDERTVDQVWSASRYRLVERPPADLQVLR